MPLQILLILSALTAFAPLPIDFGALRAAWRAARYQPDSVAGVVSAKV
ncbi:MAG TPA: hypothetical protein VIO83_11610 [Pseudomonas sp.]